jgi:hypothetical protein
VESLAACLLDEVRVAKSSYSDDLPDSLTKAKLGKAVYVYMINLDDLISIAQLGCDAVNSVFVAGTCAVLGVWR